MGLHEYTQNRGTKQAAQLIYLDSCADSLPPGPYTAQLPISQILLHGWKSQTNTLMHRECNRWINLLCRTLSCTFRNVLNYLVWNTLNS